MASNTPSSSSASSGGAHGDAPHVIHMSTRRTIFVFLIGVVVGALATYFGGAVAKRVTDDGAVCTLVGAEAALTVFIPRQDIAVEHGVTATAKVHGQEYQLRAESLNPDERQGGVEIRLPLPSDTPAGTAAIDVRFTAPSGEPQHVTYSGDLELLEPNGPDCEPHVYHFHRFIHDGQVLTLAQMEAQFPEVLSSEQVADWYVVSTDDDMHSEAQSLG